MSDEPSNDRALEADLAVLGLAHGATLAEIQREYRHRHGLYSPQSLAAYGLIDEHEQAQRLEAVETAYRRLLKVYEQHRPHFATEDGASSPTVKIETTADPNTHPGLYLREVRIAQGVSLDDLSFETKIRRTVIDQLENEQYRDLPQPVFVRGFVVQIARALSAPDPEGIAKAYVGLMEEAKKD